MTTNTDIHNLISECPYLDDPYEYSHYPDGLKYKIRYTSDCKFVDEQILNDAPMQQGGNLYNFFNRRSRILESFSHNSNIFELILIILIFYLIIYK